jgi:hypothetical protein
VKFNVSALALCALRTYMAIKLDIVCCLVKEHGAGINESYDYGLTPLFSAADHEHLELVRYMVQELGADVNKAVEDGCTPLYIAVQRGHLSLVKNLSAYVNRAMNNGSSPLNISAQTNNLDLLRCLVEPCQPSRYLWPHAFVHRSPRRES